MDEREIAEIVRREIDEWAANRPAICEYLQMMPVCEFAARDDDGKPLRVMGIALRDDGAPEVGSRGGVAADGVLSRLSHRAYGRPHDRPRRPHHSEQGRHPFFGASITRAEPGARQRGNAQRGRVRSTDPARGHARRRGPFRLALPPHPDEAVGLFGCLGSPLYQTGRHAAGLDHLAKLICHGFWDWLATRRPPAGCPDVDAKDLGQCRRREIEFGEGGL